ncbi:MAG: TRAP transporter substrate-binding protein DctP [Gammaproteobacteria bacterium]|nr:TRAP transporter substrate-binding protein DctP [Gammaproteobacteria bacterium]
MSRKNIFLAALLLAFVALPMAQAETTLKLATDSGAKGSPSGNAMDRWAELIEEGTNGEVQVDVFYQNELGSQAEVFDLFVANEVQLTLNWPPTSYDERLSVLYAPYMVLSWEEALDAYSPDGWVNNMLGEIYGGLGIKYFGAWPEGFAGVATKDKYAMTPEEASDLKVRVPPFFPMAETMQAMGYQTAAIDWSEVFTAIQTGVVDGDAANIIYWDYEYFRDTVDYYNRTKQFFVTGNIGMNMEAWESLSPEHQEVVQDAAVTIMEEAFVNGRERDQMYVEKAIEAGMEYLEPSPEQLNALATKVRAEVWPLMEERIGKDIVDTMRENAGQL